VVVKYLVLPQLHVQLVFTHGLIRLRICLSTSSSGLGLIESLADNSSSNFFLSNSACLLVLRNREDLLERTGVPVQLYCL